MSFVLPGNPRSLRFSGEAKALDLEAELELELDEEEAAPVSIAPPSSLGKPRIRRQSAAAPPVGGRRSARGPMQTPVSTRDVFDSYAAAASAPGPIVRHKLRDLDTDGDPTTAMERETDLPPRSVRPQVPAFPRPPRLPAVAGMAGPPGGEGLQGARGSTGAAPVVLRQAPAPRTAAPAGAPYLVWILASLLAGVITYNIAPRVAAHFDSSAQALTPGP